MWTNKLNRQEFVDLIGRIEQGTRPPGDLLEGIPTQPPARDDLLAVWAEEDRDSTRDFPLILIVADDRLEDFLAWTSTFFASFRPFTSYFRVLPWRTFQAAMQAGNRTQLGRFADLCLGLILAETLTQTQSRAAVNAMPMQGFSSTFSYAIARSLAVGWNDISVTAARWHDTTVLLEQPERRLGLREFDDVWGVVASLWTGEHGSTKRSGSESAISRACAQLSAGQDISEDVWSSVTFGRFDLGVMRRDMRQNKELRVRLFEKIVQEVVTTNRDPRLDAFICGYLASMVSDGTLDHAELLFPLLDRLPTALLWYGLCAGLAPRPRLRSAYNGVGYRLLRDLLRDEPLLSRPNVDLSCEEARTLTRGGKGLGEIHQSGASWLAVELLPKVTASFKWPPKRGESRQDSQLNLQVESDAPAAIEVLQELGRILEDAVALNRGVVSHMKGETPPSKEPPRRRSKKGWWK